MSTASQPSRRTQDERSSAMRERLLQATVDCLVEYGYAGTTVTRIAERAGVTRGAQVHHYRTKDDLVTAAVTHLATRSAAFGWSQIAGVAEASDPVGALLDILWQTHLGPPSSPASNSGSPPAPTPGLREHVAAVEPALLAILRAEADRPAGGNAAVEPELLDAVFTAMDTMRGLLISAWHLPEAQRNARWRRAREQLRAIFPDNERVRAVIAELGQPD